MEAGGPSEYADVLRQIKTARESDIVEQALSAEGSMVRRLSKRLRGTEPPV